MKMKRLVCKVPSCVKFKYAKDLCRNHYLVLRYRKSKNLSLNLTKRLPTRVRLSNCVNCGKKRISFRRNALCLSCYNNYKRSYYRINKKKHQKYTSIYYRKNKARISAYKKIWWLERKKK